MEQQTHGSDPLQPHSLDDLKAVLKDTLEARGSLGQIKARIRAEIFSALDDHSVPKPKLSNENLIINELIREYLEYNGYRHAHSVFLAESGQPLKAPFHREFLAKELRVQEDPRFSHVPLLYGIVASLQGGSGDGGDLASQRQRSQKDDAETDKLSQRHSADNVAYIHSPGGFEPSPVVFRK
ncbi:hypothetical protein PINS_up002386 [Pythium insidiosum]|nr:hypothetical protein PINS_up002386 [Pythium insidiosum]